MKSNRDNDVKCVFETAYLKLLDVEVCASSGNVRLPYYIYGDREARNAEHPLQVKQGVEMVEASEFAPEFFSNLDALRADPGEMTPAQIFREAKFRTGYSLLKSRGFTGVDC